MTGPVRISPLRAGPIAIGPVLNTVGFAVTGPETRLTLEMTLPQAELALERLVLAAASARARQPSGRIPAFRHSQLMEPDPCQHLTRRFAS